MSNQFTEKEKNVIEEPISAENTAPVESTKRKAIKLKFTKKKIAILGGIIIAVIAVALVIFIPSKFERVKDECVQIAGIVSGTGDYFTIDTFPDDYENMDPDVLKLLISQTRTDALEAIKYANEELGFNAFVYSKMMETTSLMGRQSEENDKYRVSWTYHPDDGLEVTYEKK